MDKHNKMLQLTPTCTTKQQDKDSYVTVLEKWDHLATNIILSYAYHLRMDTVSFKLVFEA